MPLKTIFKRKGQKICYTYDFGDNWNHSVKLEEISEPAAKTKYPRCLKGKGNCPPEDCGGVWGLYGMLEALADPEHDHYSEWLEDYDPMAFDAKAITKQMQ